MTKCFIGLGSNLGDRRVNLEAAARALRDLAPNTRLRVSPIFQTPAVIPEGASETWRIPYLNAVAELDYEGTPESLRASLKRIENERGRTPGPAWSPRLLDLDILTFGEQIVNEPHLHIPHAEMHKRSFVLDPLKHLAPTLALSSLSGRPVSQRGALAEPQTDSRTHRCTRPISNSILNRARALQEHTPLWMGILNVTPDSFSDGGRLTTPALFNATAHAYDEAGVQILDVGAESTRPGGEPVTAQDEWARLKPALEFLRELQGSRYFAPWISVDTRHTRVAAQALEMGATLLNDVSGLTDPAMLDLLAGSSCQYVLMHSLSVPADPKQVISPQEDPVSTVKNWALDKLELLEKTGISLDRIIFDPGVGFGKTPEQSLTLLKRIDEFFALPVRVLVGHSRKSFMNVWQPRPASERDPETIGVSLQLARRGVDILRVHEPLLHLRTHQAFQEVQA